MVFRKTMYFHLFWRKAIYLKACSEESVNSDLLVTFWTLSGHFRAESGGIRLV